MNFKQWLNKNEDDIDTYNYPTESMELAFNAGREQYKSIVKTVDPDNLPTVNVIALNENNFMLTGMLGFRGLNGQEVKCDNSKDILFGITKYIEQKDLIKLFEGVK